MKARKGVAKRQKELPGSIQLLWQTILENVYLATVLIKLLCSMCVVVATHSILVYVR